MAKKQLKTNDIIAEQPKSDVFVNQEKTIDVNALDQDNEPKTFDIPDQITTDFISEDGKVLLGIEPIQNTQVENGFSQQDYLEQIAHYSGELLVSLEGIFIGGHAQQVKDQLYIALNNYKNGI